MLQLRVFNIFINNISIGSFHYQKIFITVKETVKEIVPVDTDSEIHKLRYSLLSVVSGAPNWHRTTSQPHHTSHVTN